MKTIHLKLRKGINTIKLIQFSLDTTNNFTIRISRCFITWWLCNIRSGVNNTFVKDSTGSPLAVVVPQGYYTFSDLKTYLASHDITIKKLTNNHIEMESIKDLDLKSFGQVLGFEKDTSVTKDTKIKSEAPARFTNGLKTIHIHCPSLVDYDQNYSSDNVGLYFRSSLLASLSIDTTQSLNGTFTHYSLGDLRLPCRDYVGQDLEFRVESEGHVNDYEIYLTLEIE